MRYPIIFFAVAAYLAGSIPFGKLIAGYVAHIDITRRGSGNIGATNVARELGMKWGIVTLVFDVLKGLVPMVLFSWYVAGSGPGHDTALATIGLCALLGHMFPLFLGFRGGKGVATALGVYLTLSPLSCLFVLILFVLVVAMGNFVSLGSLIAACTMPFILFLLDKPAPFLGLSVAMALLICWKHKENIKRLITGTEPKWRRRPRQPRRSTNRSSSSSE